MCVVTELCLFCELSSFETTGVDNVTEIAAGLTDAVFRWVVQGNKGGMVKG